MATIDTSVIEGFDTMTAEQKLDALLKLDVPEKVDLSGYIAKSQFDKVSSELADTKKQLKGRMTEDEAKKAEDEKAKQELENRYQELLKKSTIADHTANFLALGYDKDLARSTAEALFDGDMEKVFENQKKFNEAREKQLRAELVKKDPRPDGAGGGSEEKHSDVDLAKRLAERKAKSRKESEDVMKYYIK